MKTERMTVGEFADLLDEEGCLKVITKTSVHQIADSGFETFLIALLEEFRAAGRQVTDEDIDAARIAYKAQAKGEPASTFTVNGEALLSICGPREDMQS